VRNGLACLSPHRFSSLKEVERIQQNLVLFNNDTMNRKKRWAEAMLSDGSRVTLTGFGFTQEPTLTIRFYTVRQFRLEALCRPEFATISEMMKEILLVIIRSYFNIVIIGATNTGKTQLMKSMIAEMPDNERIVTIESRFELMLKRDFPEKNIIEYEVDESDVFHSSRQAFKLALRQSPKRIIHAEIRDEDANIYVRACTRGHEGSMTTVHVNELEDAPEAITDMCMLDQRGMNPERLVKRITDYVTQIGIEMAVVQGQRKVVRIAEFSYVQGEVRAQDIVRYDYLQHQWKLAGKFSAKAAHRIQKHDPQGYAKLKALHIV
jgi:pilus assembly protein CpaF